MSKAFVICLALYSVHLPVGAQKGSYKQPEGIGIHFLFNDFQTAIDIRNSSLSTVLNDGRFGKLKEMEQGLALSYSKGVSDYFDFVSMAAGSFLVYPFPDKDEGGGGQALLLEVDASMRGKLLTDKYWVVPYAQAGVGFSKYQGYWGAYIPLGVGIQLNFFDEAYLLINSQYRIAVTESTNYHFVHSIGLVGNISNWRD